MGGGRGRSGSGVQKPARRGMNTRGSGGALRTILAYLPLVGKIMIAIITGVLIFAGYRAAASASFFETRRVDISGTSRTSTDDVKAAVRRVAATTGVWSADLQAISAEVEKLPWVRSAVVSRVLPDGLRVRVVEREPLAVVRTAAGKFVWVDEDAVTLSRMVPTDQIPVFFIRGWDESGTNEARTENRERIQKYLELSREWAELGLSERVSEVNLGDPHDIRALLSGDDAQIEVRLGERNLGSRLQKALKVLDEQRSTPLGPFITYLVASQDGKITVGHSPAASNIESGTIDSSDTSGQGPETNGQGTTKVTSGKVARGTTKRKTQSEPSTKEERNQKEKPPGDAKKVTRPRRVG